MAVFPFTDEQVTEVSDALGAVLINFTDEETEELAREALTALARVMRVERESDPMGAPRGYGWSRVRGVTDWYTIDPVET
jgi:hypothetical protein